MFFCFIFYFYSFLPKISLCADRFSSFSIDFSSRQVECMCCSLKRIIACQSVDQTLPHFPSNYNHTRLSPFKKISRHFQWKTILKTSRILNTLHPFDVVCGEFPLMPAGRLCKPTKKLMTIAAYIIINIILYCRRHQSRYRIVHHIHQHSCSFNSTSKEKSFL